MLFFIDGGIATYHAAVEKHWVKGPTACTDSGEHPFQSMEEFMNKINHAPITACDQPQWEFHGFTMASLNAIWAFVLTATIYVAMQQSRIRQKTYA